MANRFVAAFFLYLIVANVVEAQNSPESGFLPGRMFKYYPTIEKYDFNGLRLRLELQDDRLNKNLNKIICSDVKLKNETEFAKPDCIYLVEQYIDTLFQQARGILDPLAIDTLYVRLQAIDARLIGFFKIRAHGLCQMQIRCKDINRVYCIDITDADKNSPINPNAFVTRKTAIRVIASASIREVIEQFFKDLNCVLNPVHNTTN